jgi:hypothetical protein
VSEPTIPQLVVPVGGAPTPGPGAEVTIMPAGLPDPTLTQQMFDHVFGLLEAGTTNVETALEVALTELDTIEQLMAPIEAAKSVARAFCAKVMPYAGLKTTMTADRTLTRIEDSEIESFDADKLKGLIADLVGAGGRDAEIAALIAKCRKKRVRSGYLMIKARNQE